MSTKSFTGSLGRTYARSRVARSQAWGGQPDMAWLLLLALWLLVGLVLAYRVAQPVDFNVGSSYTRAHLRGFGPIENNESYNYSFSGERAQIFVPGAGGGPFAVALRFDGSRPSNVEPARVMVEAGQRSLAFAPSNGLREYRFFAPSTAGDLDIRLRTNPFTVGQDPRVLGIPLDAFAAEALETTIPVRASLVLGALALGLYLLARRLAVSPQVSGLVTLLLLSATLWGLAEARALVAVGLVRLLVVLAGLHVALWPLRALARRIYDRIGLPLSAAEEHWVWRIFAAATLVKLGGILYPHIIVFDQAAHVLRMNWILDGRFLELYRPGYTSYMGDTVGLGGGQFPYSPLWYLVVLPFRFLGLSFADASNGLSALMDVSKLFPIHVIARVTLRSRPTAVWSAALYHLIPMPLFLLSWGNYPTQFGLWAGLLALAYLVLHYEHFSQRRTFWIWVGLMALAILSYTVLGVFAVSFFVLIGIFGYLQHRDIGWRRLRFIVMGMVAAELFCFAIYHVQFAHALATETLPAIVSGAVDRVDNPLNAEAEARQNALANFAANNQFTVNHFTSLVLTISAVGALLLVQGRQFRRWWPVWAAWAALFVVYTLVSGFVADMVLKHVFIVMPLVAILTALVFDRWWRRGWAGRAAVLGVTLYLVSEVVQRQYFYLLVKRHFE